MADFNIYRNLDKIDADALMTAVFKTTDLSKVKLPKDQKINLTANGKTILIKTLVSTRLKNKIKSGDWGYHADYDLVEALGNMKSVSEVRAEIDAIDPMRHSDAIMLAAPEFNFKNMAKLSDEQKAQRIKFFVSVAALLLDPKVLTAVAEYAPKKKNGGFSKAKLIRLTNPGLTFGSSSMLMIYGKAVNDTTIEIKLDDRSATPEEAGFIAEDFVNTFINELGLANHIEGFEPDPSRTFDSYLASSDYRPVDLTKTNVDPKKKAELSKGFDIEDGVLVKYKGSDEVVVIPDGTKIIDRAAFFENETMKKVVMPDSVTQIRKHAFSYCKNLEEVDFSKNLSSTQSEVFSKCEALKYADLSETKLKTLKRLFVDDLYGCYLKEIKLPKDLRKIEAGVLMGSAIEELVIPASVESIGGNFFDINSGFVFKASDTKTCLVFEGTKRIEMFAYTFDIGKGGSVKCKKGTELWNQVEDLIKELASYNLYFVPELIEL